MPRQQFILTLIGAGLISSGIACTQSIAPPNSPLARSEEPESTATAAAATFSTPAAVIATTEAVASTPEQPIEDMVDAAIVLSAALERAREEQKLLLVHVGAPG